MVNNVPQRLGVVPFGDLTASWPFTYIFSSTDIPGVPPHNLRLKVGCVVIFMRNVNFDTGIVNSEKGVVRAVSPRIVDVEVIAPDSPLINLPRILLEVRVGSKGITFHRRQFPLRVCYAVTVNKSQGQTLPKVGLDLRDDVFCHGQLYVALSRTTCSANIMCLVRPECLIIGVPHVANCVFEPRAVHNRSYWTQIAPIQSALLSTTTPSIRCRFSTTATFTAPSS